MSWKAYIDFWFQIGSRYFMVAGIAFLFFYVLFKEKRNYKKIQQRLPKRNDYLREITFSVITICIFALVPLLKLKVPSVVKYTQFYTSVDAHGWLYFFIAFPLMFIFHDSYFYWTHRMMHQKSLFRLFHLVHHKSTNPSPWAAYAFHPLEALVEAGIFVLFLFLMPVHFLHLVVFFFFMIVYNVYGHLGYELYPGWFAKHKFGRWINTSVSHNQHHQHFKGNYGLYFTFWDYIMGTLRSDYLDRFEEITSRKKLNNFKTENDIR